MKRITLEVAIIRQNFVSLVVISLDTRRKPRGEDGPISLLDVQVRRLGNQKGLETPVVQAVNDGC